VRRATRATKAREAGRQATPLCICRQLEVEFPLRFRGSGHGLMECMGPWSTAQHKLSAAEMFAAVEASDTPWSEHRQRWVPLRAQRQVDEPRGDEQDHERRSRLRREGYGRNLDKWLDALLAELRALEDMRTEREQIKGSANAAHRNERTP